ncbi:MULTISPECIES: F0F1 ATP synthase subunit B [unclassified Pseudactinotalea]|uniref:F0F1 ATP synthase subunit B n=1 Tax=unclassified Pseudactinotalea TaxID=2649176 RepID=UPI00128C66D1|nr:MULTISPECIES: F0F1 ATP synthase subunit B [unclassified Pseudactinotalea]MPV48915.1 F0F1 ATP synthase subunit B [Pseudactinotalea sp. HY160]QGH68892.1 F0F1 ATP synthase subunit B [Pseudactinotalea sp. HY158]
MNLAEPLPVAEISGLDVLIPAGFDLFWSAVVTVVIGFFFFKYLMPKMTALLDERTAKIEGGLELAQKAQAEAAAAQSEKEAELVAARREAAGIRDEANAEGKVIRGEARDQAQAEAARILESAQRQIEAERASAVVSLREEVGSLASELASRIVGEALAEDARQSRVIDRFLDELDGTLTATESTAKES